MENYQRKEHWRRSSSTQYPSDSTLSLCLTKESEHRVKIPYKATRNPTQNPKIFKRPKNSFKKIFKGPKETRPPSKNVNRLR